MTCTMDHISRKLHSSEGKEKVATIESAWKIVEDISGLLPTRVAWPRTLENPHPTGTIVVPFKNQHRLLVFLEPAIWHRKLPNHRNWHSVSNDGAFTTQDFATMNCDTSNAAFQGIITARNLTDVQTAKDLMVQINPLSGRPDSKMWYNNLTLPGSFYYLARLAKNTLIRLAQNIVCIWFVHSSSSIAFVR